eukprot:1160046-Pelagomonas_calceolata.AAC.3
MKLTPEAWRLRATMRLQQATSERKHLAQTIKQIEALGRFRHSSAAGEKDQGVLKAIGQGCTGLKDMEEQPVCVKTLV